MGEPKNNAFDRYMEAVRGGAVGKVRKHTTLERKAAGKGFEIPKGHRAPDTESDAASDAAQRMINKASWHDLGKGLAKLGRLGEPGSDEFDDGLDDLVDMLISMYGEGEDADDVALREELRYQLGGMI